MPRSANPRHPPPPPGDIGALTPALVSLSAGTVLWRIHRGSDDPLYFGPRAQASARGRWDAPGGEFGTCYLAEEPHVAFAEALLRDLTLDYLGTETLAARSLARVTLRRDLQVVRMHGAGLRRLRATAAVVHGPYENTWKWAKALHQHPASVDGIRYRARHDDDGLSLALFDRAEDAIELNGSTPLLETTLAEALAGWLDRYGIGLG